MISGMLISDMNTLHENYPSTKILEIHFMAHLYTNEFLKQVCYFRKYNTTQNMPCCRRERILVRNERMKTRVIPGRKKTGGGGENRTEKKKEERKRRRRTRRTSPKQKVRVISRQKGIRWRKLCRHKILSI